MNAKGLRALAMLSMGKREDPEEVTRVLERELELEVPASERGGLDDGFIVPVESVIFIRKNPPKIIK